jgi:hypothetical protein
MLPNVEQLSSDQIDKLIADHWREIKGLIREIRRRKQVVSNTNTTALDTGRGDGRA